VESKPAIRAQLSRIPKAELHVHLEGCVDIELLRRLSTRGGIDLRADVRLPEYRPIPAPPAAVLNGERSPENFLEFISLYVKITQSIGTADDIIEIAHSYLKQAAAEGVIAVEAYFSPSTYQWLSIPLAPLFNGLAEAQRIAAADYAIELSWIFDIVRNAGRSGFETIEAAVDAKKRGVDVRSIGLAGLERGYPPRPFAPALSAAREAGFVVLAHAGETAGIESLVETVDVLCPARIGHGICALESEAVKNSIIEKQITLEVCPWSNIYLQIISADQHPLKALIESGIPVVIGSDDPGIFRKNLIDNYLFAYEQGTSITELERIAQRSLEARVQK
jgi:adenosine deaminase